MLRGREKKNQTEQDQTVIFHSPEQAAILVKSKLEIQTKERGNVWGRLGFGGNCELAVWLQNHIAPHPPPTPTSGRICLELGEERKNLFMPPSQLPLLLPTDFWSLVPFSLGVTCPFSVL